MVATFVAHCRPSVDTAILSDESSCRGFNKPIAASVWSCCRSSETTADLAADSSFISRLLAKASSLFSVTDRALAASATPADAASEGSATAVGNASTTASTTAGA